MHSLLGETERQWQTERVGKVGVKARESQLIAHTASAVKVLEKRGVKGRERGGSGWLWVADMPKLLSSPPTQKVLCNCAYTDLFPLRLPLRLQTPIIFPCVFQVLCNVC